MHSPAEHVMHTAQRWCVSVVAILVYVCIPTGHTVSSCQYASGVDQVFNTRLLWAPEPA